MMRTEHPQHTATGIFLTEGEVLSMTTAVPKAAEME
jgi:hypothetical protein